MLEEFYRKNPLRARRRAELLRQAAEEERALERMSLHRETADPPGLIVCGMDVPYRASGELVEFRARPVSDGTDAPETTDPAS